MRPVVSGDLFCILSKTLNHESGSFMWMRMTKLSQLIIDVEEMIAELKTLYIAHKNFIHVTVE